MGQRAPSEERYFPRYLSVVKDFPGRLFKAGKDIDAQVLDVCAAGASNAAQQIELAAARVGDSAAYRKRGVDAVQGDPFRRRAWWSSVRGLVCSRSRRGWSARR